MPFSQHVAHAQLAYEIHPTRWVLRFPLQSWDEICQGLVWKLGVQMIDFLIFILLSMALLVKHFSAA